MTKSSYGLVLLFAGWGVAADAEPPSTGLVTADQAMKHYHETFGVAPDRGCEDTARGSDEEIVVCGGPKRRYRLPLPIEREPGEIVRHINEAPSPASALSAPCFRGCDASGVNVLKIISAAPKIIGHILHPDDD